MATKRRPPKAPAVDWRSPGSSQELTEIEQLAHQIVTARLDLMPSVERIMTADLDAEGRARALTLFRDALTTPGDEHRDPRIAIAHCMPEEH